MRIDTTEEDEPEDGGGRERWRHRKGACRPLVSAQIQAESGARSTLVRERKEFKFKIGRQPVDIAHGKLSYGFYYVSFIISKALASQNYELH